MAESITIYGAIGCEHTARVKNKLRQAGVPFRCINVNYNTAAERFVLFVNRGLLITPTVVIDRGKQKIMLARPDDNDLDRVLAEPGYLVVK
ncbi:MAG TPA: glutaredoxin domain-containing protein [Ktedonobacteraceae bacterium]|nr:glutaredoxin domain-containing protein [Ktedonobacteraceae bacterium]